MKTILLANDLKKKALNCLVVDGKGVVGIFLDIGANAFALSHTLLTSEHEKLKSSE
jgi:hypothetical protein